MGVHLGFMHNGYDSCHLFALASLAILADDILAYAGFHFGNRCDAFTKYCVHMICMQYRLRLLHCCAMVHRHDM